MEERTFDIGYLRSPPRPKKKKKIITVHTHAKKNIVLGTHAKVLPNGAQFGADVFAEDVGGPRGGRKQPRQDGPFGKMKLKIDYFMFFVG